LTILLKLGFNCHSTHRFRISVCQAIWSIGVKPYRPFLKTKSATRSTDFAPALLVASSPPCHRPYPARGVGEHAAIQCVRSQRCLRCGPHDICDPSSCSRRDCIRGAGGFSSCLSIGACFLAASSTLHGTGWAGFLLGRGRGIWMAGTAPPEALLLSDDSLLTCRAEHRERHSRDQKFGRNVYSTTLVKNICAWLRICTAVLVPMCSTRTHASRSRNEN
jgi:hypothetical protein